MTKKTSHFQTDRRFLSKNWIFKFSSSLELGYLPRTGQPLAPLGKYCSRYEGYNLNLPGLVFSVKINDGKNVTDLRRKISTVGKILCARFYKKYFLNPILRASLPRYVQHFLKNIFIFFGGGGMGRGGRKKPIIRKIQVPVEATFSTISSV